jgi:cell wall-associated NlpC family hydrolase
MRLPVAAATLGLLSSTLIFSAPGAAADPSPADVQTRVNTLMHEAEVASEQYNQAKIQLTAAKQRLASLQGDLDRQQAAFEAARNQVVSVVVANYEGQTVSSTAQVLFSDNPDQVLAQLTVVLEYSDDQNTAMRAFVAKARQLSLREKAAKTQLQAIAETEQQLKQDKATLDAKAAQARQLLAQITAPPPRPQAVSRSTVRLAQEVPATGRAKIALDFALAQVGDAYVYGGTGPNGWDCSGLTMVAWGKAGVSLPHSASLQYSYGRHVSASQLQPGDLVFYYSPISHVGIYIGHGMIVNAANPREGVTILPVFSMPFAGATRLG